MLTPLINVATAALYMSAGGMLLRRLLSGGDEAGASRTAVLGLSTAAVILHAVLLVSTMAAEGGLSLGFTSTASLVAWAIAVIFLLVTLLRPVEVLGVIVLPIATLAVILAWVWPAAELAKTPSVLLNVHLVISVLAYSFLSLAMAQALLLALQERRLREHHPGRLIRVLPPLQTMEQLLFQLITVGFLLLTLTLISGVFFADQVFGKPLVFNHKTVLSITAWFIFAVLLLGRRQFGWRGRKAINWTLGGFAVLLLAYFGTKFILEFMVS